MKPAGKMLPTRPPKHPKLDKVLAPDKIVQTFLAREQAGQRVQLAQQTLNGASAQYLEADGRLKGQLEFVYGPNYTFEWKDGKLWIDPQGNPAGAPNGEVKEVTLAQLNHAARRQLKRGAKPSSGK